MIKGELFSSLQLLNLKTPIFFTGAAMSKFQMNLCLTIGNILQEFHVIIVLCTYNSEIGRAHV